MGNAAGLGARKSQPVSAPPRHPGPRRAGAESWAGGASSPAGGRAHPTGSPARALAGSRPLATAQRLSLETCGAAGRLVGLGNGGPRVGWERR